jgi:hypothetical protein
MERRKLFGDEVVAKRSLFSSKATTSRRKLFCSAASSTPRVIVCLDCGHEITVDGTTETRNLNDKGIRNCGLAAKIRKNR